jgi:preprotein translocase subunit SecG
MNDAMRVTKIVARVFAAICLVSAFVFLALGASCYSRAVRFKKTAVEAQGSVIELKEDRSGGTDSHTVYYPIIRFADKAGQEHTLYSSAGSYPPAYEVGERVPVLYDPANPKEAKINSFTGLWLWPLILGILGGLDLLTGLFLLFVLLLILRWAEKRTAKASSQQAMTAPRTNGNG